MNNIRNRNTLQRKIHSQVSSTQHRATKRIMKDLQQVQNEPLHGIAAAPLEKNLFLWHVNLLGPKSTPWEGGIFHMTLEFPRTYPDDPPTLTLRTKINHPNVFGFQVCLDMLNPRSEDDHTAAYEGSSWSSSYTAQTILVQLQAFLFEAEPSVVLKDIDLPENYEKKKREWLSGVQWSVAQSLAYQDPSIGHHPPRKPWPAFPAQEVLDKNKAALAALAEHDRIKDELKCFYSRMSYEEEVLGLPITYSKNLRTGEIKTISCPEVDFIGLRAFMNHHHRLTSNNQNFTHWLPVFIEPSSHGQKAMHLAKRALSAISTGSTKNFQPKSQVVSTLPKLMSTMLVEVMNGKKHASIRALRGYCLVHRMLLEFVKEYPEIAQELDSKVEQFIDDEKFRHKDLTPNLGEFLAAISVSSKFSFEQIRDSYIGESFTRNVFWLLNQYPDLEGDINGKIANKDRLKYSFEVSSASQKLLLFHKFFLDRVARIGAHGVSRATVAADYDANLGAPRDSQEDEFIAVSEKINSLESYAQFFQMLGISKTEEEIVALLKESIVTSKAKGYHGSSTTVLSPEELERKNKNLYDLTQFKTDSGFELDEAKWFERCKNRWGFESLPDYLAQATGVSNPWRNLYLQNNLQDFVSKLNDIADMTRFHDTLDLSTEIVQLELSMFEPSNLKSKWFYLTAVVSKLTKLTTLIIRKGETGLGIKGFKALVNGLRKNPGNLSTLVLTNCDLNYLCIEELIKGDLVSSNLSSINFSGNPLQSTGATRLAEFLRRHENLPHLTRLDLSNCGIDAAGTEAIAEILLVKRELKELIFQNNPSAHGMALLLKNLAYSPSITDVDMCKSQGRFTDYGTQSISRLLELTPALQRLNLWRVKAMAELHDSVIRNSLKANKTLKVIDFGETGFRKLQPLGEALAFNTVLEELVLCRNGITMEDLVSFLDQLYKTRQEAVVTKLNKKRTAVDDDEPFGKKKSKEEKDGEGAVELEVKPVLPLVRLDLSGNVLSYAAKHKQKLVLGNIVKTALSLTFLDLSSCGLDVHHMEGLAEALLPENNVPLKQLLLRGNKSIGQFGLKAFAASLAKNNSLEELDLSGCDLAVRGAGSIANALQSNTALKKLNLFGNLIEIEGCILITNALTQNTTLEELDIGLNRIRARGGRAVEALLLQSSTLTHIGLKHNHLNDKTAMAIVDVIANNPTSKLQRITLAGNDLSVTIRGELAVKLANLGNGRSVEFDLAKLVLAKDAERLTRTVYVTPLPEAVTAQQLKKYFQSDHGCGYCLKIDILSHRKKKNGQEKFAFVEFAEPGSVDLAVRLVHARQNNIFGQKLHIAKAGIQQLEESTKKSTREDRAPVRAIRGGRGGRGGSRGRGGR